LALLPTGSISGSFWAISEVDSEESSSESNPAPEESALAMAGGTVPLRENRIAFASGTISLVDKSPAGAVVAAIPLVTSKLDSFSLPMRC